MSALKETLLKVLKIVSYIATAAIAFLTGLNF